MPLDNVLNNGIQSSLSRHCVITAHLPDDDPCKFSLAAPNATVSGINRLYKNEGGNDPSSRRIVHDFNRVVRAFGTVYEDDGRMVP